MSVSLQREWQDSDAYVDHGVREHQVHVLLELDRVRVDATVDLLLDLLEALYEWRKSGDGVREAGDDRVARNSNARSGW